MFLFRAVKGPVIVEKVFLLVFRHMKSKLIQEHNMTKQFTKNILVKTVYFKY